MKQAILGHQSCLSSPESFKEQAHKYRLTVTNRRNKKANRPPDVKNEIYLEPMQDLSEKEDLNFRNPPALALSPSNISKRTETGPRVPSLGSA